MITKLGYNVLEGIVVETEAYYDLHDPAARACHGIENHNSEAFIYSVHKCLLLNMVAPERSKIGAVLIRAIERTREIEVLRKHRPARKAFESTNGSGKLTMASKIDKSLNVVQATRCESEIITANSSWNLE